MARAAKIDIQNLGWKVRGLALEGKSNGEIVEVLNREFVGCGITDVDVSRYLKSHPIVEPAQVEIVERARTALIGDALLTLETARGMLFEIRDEIQRQIDSNLDPKTVGAFVALKLQAFDRVLAVLRLDGVGGQIGPFALSRDQNDPACKGCFWYSHMTLQHLRDLLKEG